MAIAATFKLNTLVVDPTVACRIRLKEALTALPRFNSIIPMNSLKEAQDTLRTGTQTYDIIFISQNLDRDETASFIKNAKEYPTSRDAAFVILFKSAQNADMASSMLIGFDGMLSEPYSVNSLNDICELALRVKNERSTAREQIALGLMVQDVSKHLDAVAVLKACGYESLKGMEKFREACLSFKHLSDTAVKSYEDIAERVFGNAMPAKPPEKKYGGVSKRIKSKMANKIVDGASE